MQPAVQQYLYHVVLTLTPTIKSVVTAQAPVVWLVTTSYLIPGIYLPVAPVAYQVILVPGIGRFREFEPRRGYTRINSLGLFLVHNGLAESARP